MSSYVDRVYFDYIERRFSLEVRLDDLNDVLCGFFGGLRVLRHMIPNVIFQKLTHKAVDRSSGCGKALQDIGALLIFVEATQDALELSDNFLGPVYEIQFFSG
jgi:hypothetical protein